MLNITFSPTAWNQYLYWQKTDKQILKRINMLLKELQRNSKSTIGKAELLKGEFQGFASQRINKEHRLIYRIDNNNLEIAQLRFHYHKG